MKLLVDVCVKKCITQEIMKKWSLNEYVEIMNNVRRESVSENIHFQRKFKHFYKVRVTNEWCKVYFDLFEEMKNDKSPTFAKIIMAMQQGTKGMAVNGRFYDDGRVEASFSSKMLATLNPDKPIWDSHVLKQLGVVVPTGSVDSRVQQCIEIYEKLENEYDTFMKTEKARELIRKFDVLQPNYVGISPVKKVDYLVWTM